MKVGYLTIEGPESTAYLDDPAIGPDHRYAGQDKYTDEPIVVEWDDEAEVWRQITTGDE